MHVEGRSLMQQWLTVVKSFLSIANAGKGGLKARIDGPQDGLLKDREEEREEREASWQCSCVEVCVTISLVQ